MKSLGKRKILKPVFVLSTVLILLTFLTNFAALASEWGWPRSLTIAVPGVGSSTYVTAAAWMPLLEKMTGMKTRILPENRSPVVSIWLVKGEIDLFANSSTGVASYNMEAKKGYATREGGPYQVRTIWLNQILNLGYMVRGDSSIKTIHDIKPGTKCAYWTGAPAASLAMDALLAWAGINKKEIKVFPFSTYPASLRSVPEGKADIAYGAPTSAVAFEGESAPHGLRWIPLEPKKDSKGAERYLKLNPSKMFGVCKAGVKSAVGVPMLSTPFYIHGTANTDTNLAYHLAKWFHENFDAYKDKHANCKQMSLNSFLESLEVAYLPVHEGTIRYLKEIGKWSAKDDARQKYNVSLIEKYQNAYKLAIAQADKQKVEIDPKNEAWIAIWNNYKKDIPIFKVMLEIP